MLKIIRDKAYEGVWMEVVSEPGSAARHGNERAALAPDGNEWANTKDSTAGETDLLLA